MLKKKIFSQKQPVPKRLFGMFTELLLETLQFYCIINPDIPDNEIQKG